MEEYIVNKKNTKPVPANEEVQNVSRKISAMNFDDQLIVADSIDTSVIIYSFIKRGFNVYKTYKAGKRSLNNGGNNNEQCNQGA